MAFEFEHRYHPDVEQQMQAVYQTLAEKERRRYAAIEAAKLPRGGIQYIADLFGCSRRTVERGLEELDQLPDDPAAGRQRRPGAGRKPATEDQPELEDNLYQILDVHLAGDPDEPDVLWTDLSLPEIAEQAAQLGTPVSPPTVENWLKSQDISRRQIDNALPGGHSPDRNQQFEHIARLRRRFRRAGDPIFSLDTKAKEHLGLMYREGRIWCDRPFLAYDHDYPSWADGVLIPQGIYDPIQNHGHITLGLSHDTSQFVCDSFLWYWQQRGKADYPRAKQMLWLCDAGGSTSYRHHIFKQELERLARQIGLPIRVAHYPSYCSKFNPIERRFFPHVSRACQGMLFDTLDTVKRLMRKTSTRTGLTSSVHVIKKFYETGQKVRENFFETVRLKFSRILPDWNYTVQPH